MPLPSLRSASSSMDIRTMSLLALALLSATAPLELSQLAFALVGALAYVAIQALTPQAAQHVPPPKALCCATKQLAQHHATPCSSVSEAPAATASRRSPGAGAAAKAPGSATRRPTGTPKPLFSSLGGVAGGPAQTHPRQEVRQPSSQPVVRPTFTATGWDAEVEELLGQISPSAQGQRVVKELAEIVKRELSALIPEIEVLGFASGDLVRGTAFGVAVPEVDIVASASPHVLALRTQGARGAVKSGGAQVDVRKLQKSTIRCCTDRLVGTGGFKFRRSAFRGQDPKVTLLASTSLGVYGKAIPLDFSVNSTTPLYNAALLTECGQMDPRSRALILLVKRWAKDRGICHAAKGHLSPYAWTLLVIYFLQVGVSSPGALLPPIEEFELSSGLAAPSPSSEGAAEAGAGGGAGASQRPKWTPPEEHGPKMSIGSLFKGFLRFYTEEYDYKNEAVSVRRGMRAPPGLGLPLQIIVHEDGVTTEVALSIEDPFDPKHNLGECTTAQSFTRFKEEFARARALCCQGGQGEASLSELLEPWMPPAPEKAEAASTDKRDSASE